MPIDLKGSGILDAEGDILTRASGAPSGIPRSTFSDDLLRYVASTGSDSNDGRLPGTPFATINHAADELRATGTSVITVVLLDDIEVDEPVIVYEGMTLRGHGVGGGTTTGRAKITASASFTGDAVIQSDSWLENDQYCHWMVIEDITVDCAGESCVGFGLRGLGEASALRRCHVLNSGGVAAYYLTGTHASGHLENCVANDCAGPIVKLGEHPLDDTGPAAGTTGNVRLIGVSGDRNGEGSGANFLHMTGNYVVDVISGKYEDQQDAGDAVVLIDGTATGGGRPSLSISGRFDAVGGGGDFIKIDGSVRPRLHLGALFVVGTANFIVDDVVSRTIPLAGGNAPTIVDYDSDGDAAAYAVVGTSGYLTFPRVVGTLATQGQVAKQVIAPLQMQATPAGPSFTSVGGPGTFFHAWHMDAAVSEAMTTIVQPPSWATTVSVQLWWWNAGGGSGDVRWRSALIAATLGSGTQAITGDTSATATALAVNEGVLTTLTPATAIDPAKLYSIYLQRVATDGADTLANDAAIGAAILTFA